MNKDVSYVGLLQEAVEKPGKILEAYRAFHRYSLGNILLAMTQCNQRELPMGALATFKQWQLKGRHVRKGEQALTMLMPAVRKITRENEKGEAEERKIISSFFARRHWFVLAQTEGNDYEPEPIPGFSLENASKELQIQEIPFSALDGNLQGYACERQIAINPLAALPMKTRFHEMAHIVLGHTEQGRVQDPETLPRDIREAEAESVAMLCLAVLELPGIEYCRGYIQTWLQSKSIPEESARRIITATDSILRAGRVEIGPDRG